MQHSPDCDGYRMAHYATDRHISRENRGMWRAECEYCDWRGTTVGPDARDLARTEARGHSSEVPCAGECLA